MAGNAFNLHEDLEKARELFPDVPVIAVNGAAGEVAAIGLFSYHPQRYIEPPYRWIERQKKFHNGFNVHACIEHEPMPWVDYWWRAATGKGGSAWGARKLAWFMGFEPVILCGAPLVIGNYAGYKLGLLMTHQDVVDDLLRGVTEETHWHEGVFSMSGRTRDLLGEPC